MASEAREAMAEGALLALLFAWNGTQVPTSRADRVTVTLHLGDDGIVYSDATYWAGEHPVGGEGF